VVDVRSTVRRWDVPLPLQADCAPIAVKAIRDLLVDDLIVLAVTVAILGLMEGASHASLAFPRLVE
jgi:hypothetical protein